MVRLLLAASLLIGTATGASAQTRVDGYYRNNGTYVAPHNRSAPDSSYNNNWNVKPNLNPYTGNMGTHKPTWNNQPPPSNPYGGVYGRQYRY